MPWWGVLLCIVVGVILVIWLLALLGMLGLLWREHRQFEREGGWVRLGGRRRGPR